MPKASLDPPDPKDPEKVDVGLKMKMAAEEEEVPVVDVRKASLIMRTLDVFFVVYLLFYVGIVAVMVIVSDNWWDPWPGVLFLSPICIVTLWLTPKMKDVYVQLYATKKAPKSDSDLCTKLLAFEKQTNK
ncbi:unnamed protein product [Miscanthus lutarioriparius]|uniref:Uncharacterized protein n=1 Tax=Miscanthus lutarioriparius TaxID=422564 RepID=A0A811SKY2_9POAL|nr:unnamed protein product [Miscanthus lutarioriparius]